MRRRLTLVLALAVAAVGLAAPPAQAVARPGDALPESLTTEHFHVHYTGDSLDQPLSYVTREKLGEFAATLEWAYDTYVNTWGYPANHTDALGPDTLADVYVRDLDGPYRVDMAALAWPDDDAAAKTSGWIEVDPEYIEDEQVAAHAAFALVQLQLYAPAPRWLKVSTAYWAAFHLRAYPSDDWAVAHAPDNSVDCQAIATALRMKPCAEGLFEAHGYTRWTFWEYLNQRYGRDAVRDVWEDMETNGPLVPGYDGDDALAAVLTTKGTTLADFFNDYSKTVLTGDLAAKNVRGEAPAVYGTIETPSANASMVPVRVAVNRLAARYLQFAPPAQLADAPCHPATLTLTVTLPSGVSSKPHFFWPATGTVTALSVSGTTATASVAWDTCSSDAPGYLSLPNASRTLDGRTFVVGASVAVDTSKIVSAKQPPPGVTVIGAVIAAPTEDPAPTLHLYAPEVLSVLSTARVIRLVVFSSAAGRLQASFGGADLGTVPLRAGGNRVVLRLPKQAARMISSRRSVLALTSLAPDAAGWGTRVTQRIAVKAPPKAKPKPKRRAGAKRP